MGDIELEEKKISEKLEHRMAMCGGISEEITSVELELHPLKLIKKLSRYGKLDQSTFADIEHDKLAKLTSDMVETIHRCMKTMRHMRNALEEYDDMVMPSSDNTPQLASQISDLQCKLDTFVSAPPAAPDWSKLDFTTQITEAVAKAPQLQSPVSQVNNRQQVNQANEEHLRSNNLIIYNVPHDKGNPVMAQTYAKDYFDSCGITSYNLNQNKILDAQFLSISEDENMCNLRVIMNNPWVVRTLLSDARKLKTTEATMYRTQTFDYSKTYVSKDMTKVEQDINRKLVLELKRYIKNDPSTRWVIKFGRVQAGGPFKPSYTYDG